MHEAIWSKTVMTVLQYMSRDQEKFDHRQAQRPILQYTSPELNKFDHMKTSGMNVEQVQC